MGELTLFNIFLEEFDGNMLMPSTTGSPDFPGGILLDYLFNVNSKFFPLMRSKFYRLFYSFKFSFDAYKVM